ncbi:unnamed protein product [Lactuca saligna]|uniref:Uncharacterized protein n=1 Tax=Lactuca saligna TaxID=75948 RepID=A0AA35YU44_LACSI|nr:unnamed protein product [Lactuca saligna]
MFLLIRKFWSRPLRFLRYQLQSQLLFPYMKIFSKVFLSLLPLPLFPLPFRLTITSFLDTLTKEHSANLEKTNKEVDTFASVCNETTKNVDKLIKDAHAFMEKFQSSFESNTTKANEVISRLGSTLKIEKAKLEVVRTGLQTDHSEFSSSISYKITKL